MDRRVGPDGSGEHPHQADPADVGVRRRLHHLGEQRRVIVTGQLRMRDTLRGKDLRQWVLHRRRKSAGGYLKQFQCADPGAAAHRNHREERASGDGFLQILDQHRLVDRLAAEVALHQGLILGFLDDSFDQGAARLLDSLGVRLGRGSCRSLAVGVLVQCLRKQSDQAVTGRQVER
ncbi:Uncharacterised protein [Mycobacterium tuberculosis]|nr:Uncharacterised protein [Mycobacterium tuberculosis]